MPKCDRSARCSFRRLLESSLIPVILVATGAVASAGESKGSNSFFGVTALNPGPDGPGGNTCDRPGSVSANGLEFFFDSGRLSGSSCAGDAKDIYRSVRASVDEPFGPAERLDWSVSGRHDGGPRISFGGERLYFVSNRPNGTGGRDIWIASRESDDPGAAFTDVRPLDDGPVNTASDEGKFALSCDELVLVISGSSRGGGRGQSDIWITERDSIDDTFGEPRNVGSPVNTMVDEFSPSISCSGLTLFFHDWWQNPRPGGTSGNNTIWAANRASRDDAFGSPIELYPALEAPGIEAHAAISFDWPATGSKIYFSSSAGVTEPWRMFEATWGGVPHDLQAEATGTGIHLTWENGDTYDAVRILRGIRGTEMSVIATVDGDATSYTDSDPFDGCAQYRVLGDIGDLEMPTFLVDGCFPAKRVRLQRGRVNSDGVVDLSDAVAIVSYLFLGGDEPSCLDSADVDDNGAIEISDTIYLLNHLFLGGRSPRTPFRNCLPDRTVDRLSCLEFPQCE